MEHARHSRVRAAGISRRWLWLALGMLLLVGGAASLRPAAAQEVAAAATVSAGELEEIVGPIALYPDDLVAIVLPASTYPLQVVEAARFLEERERDPDLKPDEDWDESIVALLNYPEVVEMLNDDLDWLYDLGAAVLNQRADVLDAIQGFRNRAYAAGNLRTDDRQTVTRADRTIEIKPANPQVIYVPYYEPERVIVYQTIPVYHYYPRRYPVYYYPYPSSFVFDTGFFFGVRTWFSLGWHTHHLHVYDWGYHGHPYYGWAYYDPWYVRNVYVNINVPRHRVWEPRYRYGGRPVVRGYEGRVYTANEPPRVSGGVAGSALRNRTTEGPARTAPVPRTSGGVAGSAYRNRTPSQPTGVAPSTRGEQGRVSRGVAGSALRNRAPVEPGSVAPSATAEQPTAPARVSGGVAGSAYRNRSIDTTERARAAAEAYRPSAPVERAAPQRQGTYRSGGGMSQALERSRAISEPSREMRAGPRYEVGQSTGMPREAPRAERQAPTRVAPPASHEPSFGGGEARGGSYRGGGVSGGQQQHQPVRGGNGRSASR
jgi:hypothetical protein